MCGHPSPGCRRVLPSPWLSVLRDTQRTKPPFTDVKGTVQKSGVTCPASESLAWSLQSFLPSFTLPPLPLPFSIQNHPNLLFSSRKCVREKGRDFPASPVIKTLPSNAGGMGSIPGLGAKIPPASWPKKQNITPKQYCNKFDKDFKNDPPEKKS